MSKDTFVISRKTDVHTDNMANPVLKNAVDIFTKRYSKSNHWRGRCESNYFGIEKRCRSKSS